MKKKALIFVVVAVLVILFVPVPTEVYKDGGTSVYSALTYKIVDWNREFFDGVYTPTKVYFGLDRFKSLDELWENELPKKTPSQIKTFSATVLEINGDSVLVKPSEGEQELKSSDKITFSKKNLQGNPPVGAAVKITYNGVIMESYPAQIVATKWGFSTDFRPLKYSGEWLDKDKAEKLEAVDSGDFVIDEIYADCFFVSSIVPMPNITKINGNLSDDWCVGDKVKVTYDLMYNDEENNKFECDMLKIEESTFELDPFVAYKPVIYLYPEKETDVSVKLDVYGKLTVTDPEYKNGWNVTALPDGTIIYEGTQTYNYLFWEAEMNTVWDLSRGFCVKGEDTQSFLSSALKKQGLNQMEIADFLEFWLPHMQNNPYNIISFQGKNYTDSARLKINPNPDTLIRVFMAYKRSENYVEIAPQCLSAPKRESFTAVEWGGTVVP